MKTRLYLVLLVVLAGSACNRTLATPEKPIPTAAFWPTPTPTAVSVTREVTQEDSTKPESVEPSPTAIPESSPRPADDITPTPEPEDQVGDPADEEDEAVGLPPPAAELPAQEATSEDEGDAVTAPDEPAVPSTHLVQPGENLYRISLEYGLDHHAVAAENQISNPDLIFAGEQLKIPHPNQPSSPRLPITHTVGPGENLFRIGIRYGVPWQSIAQQNGLTRPDTIFTGQILTIGPAGAALPPALPAAHTVQHGENLYRIGLYYGVPWPVIAQANGITDPTRVPVGSVLTIPKAE